MSLTKEDIAAIEGIVAQQLQPISKLVNDHDLTLFGPNRAQGMHGEMKDVQASIQKMNGKFRYMAGIATVVSTAASLLLVWFRRVIP